MMQEITNDSAEDDQPARLITGCAFAVANGLGTGFFEKVYENALANRLRKAGFTVDQQQPVVLSGVISLQ